MYERLLGQSPRRAAATIGNGQPPEPSTTTHGDLSADWASAYLTVAAHDVRSPLAAIQGYVETLMAHGRDMGTDDREQMLGRIGAIATRMDLTTRNILDTDRIERGGLDLSVEEVSLAQVWQRATTDVSTAGHHVETDLDVQTAYADQVALERIVGNLLANAVAHTPEGTSIVLRSRHEDGAVIVSVVDDGPGVPDEPVEAVNAPGGEHLSQSWNGGSGLGVALLRRLAELHGGCLTVHNDGGTSFRIRLPDRQAAGVHPGSATPGTP